MAKKDNGIQEWINYCWEMMNNNPYAVQDGYVSHDFDKDLERAVKYKIYHTALYEYQLKLKGMMETE